MRVTLGTGALAFAFAFAFAFAPMVVACASLLGGLDEGTAADSGAPLLLPPSEAEAAPVPGACGPWLVGFGFRVPFVIHSNEAVDLAGYSIELSFDTRDLVAGHKMRADGADLRVTAGDGTTVVPHWVQSGIGGEATRFWTKVDLPAGRDTRFFVYYGNDSARDVSSFRDTFVDGIDNGRFDEGTAPWFSTSVGDAGAAATFEMGQRRAAVHFAVGRGVSFAAGWCQAVTFPPGRRYRLTMDATVLDASWSVAAAWTGGVGGKVIWSTDNGRPGADIDTGAIDAGSTLLCLGGATSTDSYGHSVNVEFANLRARVYAETLPVAGPPGPEERVCTR